MSLKNTSSAVVCIFGVYFWCELTEPVDFKNNF